MDRHPQQIKRERQDIKKRARNVAVDDFTAYLLYGYQSWNSLYDHFIIDEN